MTASATDVAAVPGLFGYYASKQGRVYSLRQSANGELREIRAFVVDKLMRAYVKLTFVKGGLKYRKTYAVGEIILITFGFPKPNKLVKVRYEAIVMYKNGNTLDNKIDNVMWGTRSSK